MLELESMTQDQLEHVPGFRIWNQFGEVAFYGDTDLTGVDLADIVTIRMRDVEVYDDEKHRFTKPRVGQKLNRPALITIKNMKPNQKKNQTAAQKEQALIQALKKADPNDPAPAEHIGYDAVKGIWEFRVQHFTRWGQDESDDEDDEEVEAPEVANNAQAAQNKRAEEHKATAFQQVPSAAQAAKPAAFTAQFESQPREQASRADQDYDMEVSQAAGGVPQQLNGSAAAPPYASFVASQRFPGKRLHVESASERDSEVIDAPMSERSQQRRGAPDRDGLSAYSRENAARSRAAQVEERIRQREELFKQASPLTCQKPSDEETRDYLAALGVGTRFAKTSLRSGIPRPSFGPNGQITFVHGDKIRIVQTEPVKSPQALAMSETVLKHSHIEKKNAQELGSQMQNMSLHGSDEDPSEALRHGAQLAQKSLFSDSFFNKLLEKELPSAAFCQTKGLQTVPKV